MSANYELELQFDDDVLKTIIQAGQQIMLAKPISGEAPNVIWLSIDPSQNNRIMWEESYGIYASDADIQEGAKITMVTETDFPASDQGYYRLTAESVFEGPYTDRDVNSGTYAAHNEVPFADFPSLTFGLTQSALVDGMRKERRPLSATQVLSRQMAEMTPSLQVYIWLQTKLPNGTIIQQARGTPTIATFGHGVNQLTLKYSPELGTFRPA